MNILGLISQLIGIKTLRLTRVSESAEAFAQHLHDLHHEIRNKIQASNFQYKIHADTRRRHMEFQVEDYIMI